MSGGCSGTVQSSGVLCFPWPEEAHVNRQRNPTQMVGHQQLPRTCPLSSQLPSRWARQMEGSGGPVQGPKSMICPLHRQALFLLEPSISTTCHNLARFLCDLTLTTLCSWRDPVQRAQRWIQCVNLSRKLYNPLLKLSDQETNTFRKTWALIFFSYRNTKVCISSFKYFQQNFCPQIISNKNI
jgi:hypothetical protein